MKIRGVQSDGEMVTSALFGVFRDDYAVRQEFLNLAGMK
jgi:GTP cyclohydrolase I